MPTHVMVQRLRPAYQHNLIGHCLSHLDCFWESLLYRNLRQDYGSRKRTNARLQLFKKLQDASRPYRYVRCLEIVLPQVCADEQVIEITHLLRKVTDFASQLKIFQEGEVQIRG